MYEKELEDFYRWLKNNKLLGNLPDDIDQLKKLSILDLSKSPTS
jgi:hypothetical protein